MSFGANLITPIISANNTAMNFNISWLRNDSVVNKTETYQQTIKYSYEVSASTFNSTSVVEGNMVLTALHLTNHTAIGTITSLYLTENGETHQATQIAYNGTLNYYTIFDARAVPTGDSVLDTYNWTASIYYNGSTRQMNFSTDELTISKMIVTFCNDENLTAVIYRTYDENTWAKLNNSNYKITVIVGAADLTRTYSHSVNFSDNISLCIYPTWVGLYADIALLYDNKYVPTNTYPQRQWNERVWIDNATKNNSVYLINTTNAAGITIATNNIDNLPEPGVLVLFQKFNYTDNAFVNMTTVLTSVDGVGYTYLAQYETPYRILLLDSANTVVATYEEYLILESSITLRTSSSFTSYYDVITNVYAACSYDNNTKVLLCSYNDPSSTITTIRFAVMESGLWGNEVICNETRANSYSGTFTCDLSLVDAATSGFVYRITAGINPEKVVLMGVISKSLPTIYAAGGVALALFVFLGLFFVGIWNPAVAIPLGLLGFFAAIWLGLLNVGTAWEYGIGLLAVIVVLVVWRLR